MTKSRNSAQKLVTGITMEDLLLGNNGEYVGGKAAGKNAEERESNGELQPKDRKGPCRKPMTIWTSCVVSRSS